MRSVTNSDPANPLRQAKGVLLLGVPGSGKSAFAKALGRETGRPTLIADIGSLMGKYVGETEENTERFLQVIDAVAPCVLMFDEVEKVLAPGEQAHEVSSRMLGKFLTWLNDHVSDVFVICTCNDIHRILKHHPEFGRAERFDAIFFVDLPTPKEKARIWEIYEELYQLESQDRPKDENWTGAEIRACCRLASLLEVSLVESAENVVPVAVTAKERIGSLRDWAKGRCLSATAKGRYKGPGELVKQSEVIFGDGGGTRKVKRKKRPPDPSNN
jgi:SpoVK/Ycf46/Vps4 family AAA+-type ATPase